MEDLDRKTNRANKFPFQERREFEKNPAGTIFRDDRQFEQ